MIGPLAAAGQELEAAGAGIQQRQSLGMIGTNLVNASIQLSRIATLVEDLAQSSSSTTPYPDGILSAQRMTCGAEQMRVAGMELMKNGQSTDGNNRDGMSNSTGNKAWLTKS